MKDRTQEGYEAIQDELRNLESSHRELQLKIKESYKDRESAAADARSFNDISFRIAKLKKRDDIKAFYEKKYPGCTVDIFLEPPFENCALLGYEKQLVEVSYDAMRIKKDKVLVGVDYVGSVSTVSNSVNVREIGNYVDIYLFNPTIKAKKVSYYIRITKAGGNKVELDDKAYTYIDAVYLKKPTKPNVGFKLFTIFNHISKISLFTAMLMIVLRVVGSNFVIGRMVSRGKIESLGAGFVGFFNSPVLYIMLLSLIGIYIVGQIGVIVTAKHYNDALSTKDFEKVKNVPTLIVNTIVMLSCLGFFLFANTISFAYSAAPHLPYGEFGGIFGGLGYVERFASIAHAEATRAFTFATNLDAAIYLSGVAISFCELVGVLLLLFRMLLLFTEILLDFGSNIPDAKDAMYDRSKLSAKKLAEYETKLKEFNQSLVYIEDKNLYPGVWDRELSVFSCESDFREGKKASYLHRGRFNPAKIFIPFSVIPLIGIVFFVFDGIHDLAATGFFPGSNFVKYAGYVIFIAISGGLWFLFAKVHEKCSKLD